MNFYALKLKIMVYINLHFFDYLFFIILITSLYKKSGLTCDITYLLIN